jgi:CDP-diglyceride synthetase
LLVTLVLLTLIAAIVPLTLGFKASNETGTTSDADFWYNISSSIFTIMANFAMIIQLTQGSRLSKQYMYVWIWFSVGVLCAVVSVTIYPFCNTAWSSLLSFFATVSGFGATLSVAMTVANPRSDEPLAKKKVD